MNLPQRKPNRLKAHDYSTPGAYFVTICTEGRKKTLCEIVGDGFPVPKTPGIIAEAFIKKIPMNFPQVRVDHYVVMPNHIHILLSINRHSGTGNPSPTLGSIIGWYKYQVTKQINAEMGAQGTRFFQRSYHDHVLRGERDYQKIWNYIEGNPLKWAEDCFYVKKLNLRKRGALADERCSPLRGGKQKPSDDHPTLGGSLGLNYASSEISIMSWAPTRMP